MQDSIAFAPKENDSLRTEEKQNGTFSSPFPFFSFISPQHLICCRGWSQNKKHTNKTQNKHKEPKKLTGHLAVIYTPNFTNEEMEAQI